MVYDGKGKKGKVMRKVSMRQFLRRVPYPDEAYVKVVWPVAKIDMTHAIKYYRIAAQNATRERLLSVLTDAWQADHFTLNKPSSEGNLFEWVLQTAEIELLFAIALELEGEFE